MLIPKKSLGQNFLLDQNLCKKIVSNINIKNNNIIEIGSGTGLLTNEIIKQNKNMHYRSGLCWLAIIC